MKSPASLARRDFLRASAALGGGLLIALRVAPTAGAQAPLADAPDFAPNAFVRIAPSGRVTVVINKAEMGQGVCTSLAMLLAEELDADWSSVAFEFAPVDALYDHPGMPIQFTGGSTSVAGMSAPLRSAGAAARALLVAAAAERWGVPAAECRTRAGFVTHPNGSRAGFGELADAAARLSLPEEVALKDPADFRILGRDTLRLDTPDKVTGKAIFSIDVALPGMWTALVLHPPVFGGKPVRWDEAAALAVPGVRRVLEIPSGLAVVAEGFWAAKRGRDALAAEWRDGEHAKISSAELREQYRALARTPGRAARSSGDARAALAQAERTLEADYELPYLAHAPMEPLNCVVELREGACQVWAGSQFQTVDRAAAARAAGLEPEQVQLHTTFLGGGFGRRATPSSDYIVEAVEIAKRCRPAPVKLVWTREDDMRGGYYRPMWHSHIAAALDADAGIAAWKHTLVGQSFLAGTPFEAFAIKDGIDATSVEGAEDLPYAIPNVQVELHTTEVGVPTLWWRSVGHSHTAFVVESFLDELAHAAGRDPLELRRELLAREPRHLGVLNAAWSAARRRALPAGRARGVAVHFSFQSYVAHVAEVSIEAGRPRVHRVVCAVDCGRVVNPAGVRAQLEGAVGFGLTAALYSEITLDQGRVQQSNFHDYPMLRIHEMPEVEVEIVPSDAPSTGVGEPGVPTVAPALCNALFQLTGKRIRRLPIQREDLA